MKINDLNGQAQRYFRRFYGLTGVAMVVMTMVLTGSVVLGDSVRDSLVGRVAERLGSAQTIISSGEGMLNDSILKQEGLRDASGYLLAEGFVASGGRMLPVMVWGTDEDSICEGHSQVNGTLWRELEDKEGVVVHLPSNSMVPSGSLFVSQRYTTTMRLKVDGVKVTENGGDRWLHNEQMRPMNLFVNRREMADVMGMDGRINLILCDRVVTEEDFARCWNPAYSGIRLMGEDTVCVTSERGFLSKRVVEALYPLEVCNAYFVNRLWGGIRGGDSIPYSFVTATSRLTGNDAVLSDVAARRMGVKVGDLVEMEYFVVKGLKRLTTRTHRFVVKDIVPLSAFVGDEGLMANFPGLSNVERCTDWDSDLPIDMSKIGKEDEDYWEQYGQTPKAMVAWEAVRNDWSNAYGEATAVRCQLSDAKWGMEDVTPHLFGVTVVSPREDLIRLAAGGTDFGGLFLALAFFILVSAVLLMLSPLSEMYYLRRDELLMYEEMGFRREKVRWLLFREAMPVLFVASPIGVVAGCVYAALSLWLLSGAWRGATHTEGFTLHVHPVSVAVAWMVGLLICVCVLWVAFPKRRNGEKKTDGRWLNGRWLIASWVLLGGLLLFNFWFFHSMILFVVGGLGWIACAGWWGEWFVMSRAGDCHRRSMGREALWWSALKTHLSRHRVTFWTLATGVFMVFAVGLNRPATNRFSDEATGGYSLYAECCVPVQYDLNSPKVRRHLKLDEIGDDVHFLQMQRHREDEASCLNLNKVATPSVLAMELQDMASFGVDTTVFANVECQMSGVNFMPIPVVLDEEALMWSVMKSVGDTLQYLADDGRRVDVLIVGSYPVGVLHGNVLMRKEDFNRLWQEESGSSVLLAKDEVSNPKLSTLNSQLSTAEVLATAMADYGVEVMSVDERMARFFEVTDTYLSIFMALGGLGLLLGIVSLVVVVRKHLAARRQETALYAALGFSSRHIVHLLRLENLQPALYAILTGAIGSVISISASMSAVHEDTWLMAVGLLLLVLTITILFIHYIINSKTIGK